MVKVQKKKPRDPAVLEMTTFIQTLWSFLNYVLLLFVWDLLNEVIMLTVNQDVYDQI